jgi:hypothetical protein
VDEIEFDRVVYISLYHTGHTYLGNPSDFFFSMEEKDRHEIRRKMIKHLIEAGYLIRKDDLEKKNSIYGEDELFHGL